MEKNMLTKEDKAITVTAITMICIGMVIAIIIKSGVMFMLTIMGLLICIYLFRHSKSVVPKKSTKRLALEHYDRMIRWAKTQNPLCPAIRFDMKRYLGISWTGDDCSYCKENAPDNCARCKLCGSGADEYSLNGEACCEGLWSKMARANSWHEWIRCAKEVREYIRKNG